MPNLMDKLTEIALETDSRMVTIRSLLNNDEKTDPAMYIRALDVFTGKSYTLSKFRDHTILELDVVYKRLAEKMNKFPGVKLNDVEIEGTYLQDPHAGDIFRALSITNDLDNFKKEFLQMKNLQNSGFSVNY